MSGPYTSELTYLITYLQPPPPLDLLVKQESYKLPNRKDPCEKAAILSSWIGIDNSLPDSYVGLDS